MFDLNTSLNSHLKTSVWKKCIVNLLEMMKILQENQHIRVRVLCVCVCLVLCWKHKRGFLML